MKLLLLVFALWLGSVPTANAVTGDFAPGFDANGLSAASVFGDGYFLQTVVARGRFHVSPLNPDTFDPTQGRSNDHRELTGDKDEDLFTDLTWFVGYNLYSSGANDVYDLAHTLKIGLAWDVAEKFDIIASVSYQSMPDENYTQGNFETDLGYYISFAKQHEKSKIEGEDAEAFYLRKAREQEDIVYPPKDSYPNLKLGGIFNFATYNKNPVTSGTRVGEEVAITSAQSLNQAASGPYATYALNSRISFRAEFLVWLYDNPASIFASYNAIGLLRPRSGLALASLNDTTLLLNTFPFRTFTASTTIKITPTTTLQGAIQDATYFGSSNTVSGYNGNSIAVGGILTQQVTSKFRLGGEVDVTSASGPSNPTQPVAGVSATYQF